MGGVRTTLVTRLAWAVVAAGLGILSFVVAVTGAFFHRWASPIGLILAIGSVVGVCVFARYAVRTRVGLTIVGLLWVVPVLILAQPRPAGDVIVAGDPAGLIFLFGGVLALAVTIGVGAAR